MYCSQRHVLRHGWHFPSWPKVLLAHCPLAGLSGRYYWPLLVLVTAARKRGGSLQNYALPFRA